MARKTYIFAPKLDLQMQQTNGPTSVDHGVPHLAQVGSPREPSLTLIAPPLLSKQRWILA